MVALVLCRELRPDGQVPQQGAWTRPVAERERDPFPRTFVNADGEVAHIAAAPQRIVSATVFSDAVLLDICPADRLAAVLELSSDARYSPVAAAAAAFPRRIGGAPEEILAAAPDLVVVAGFSRKEVRNLLGGEGCAVLRFLGFDDIGAIQNNIRALGYAVGLDRAAEGLVAEMAAELAAAANGREGRADWRLLHYASGFTSGTGTTFDALLAVVGATNAAAELSVRSFQAIAPEQVLILDPDALVVGVEPAGEAAVREQLLQLPGFAALRALQRDRLLLVPNALLLSTSHHVAQAATHIAAALDDWGNP